MVPLKLADHDGVGGLEFIPPLTLCALIVTLVILVADCALRKQVPLFHFKAVAVNASLSGSTWAIGACAVA